jgi:hypothetical protein
MRATKAQLSTEKTDLDAKLTAMDTYFGTAEFTSLEMEERVRMNDQRIAMRQHSTLLAERIAKAPV